MEIATGPPIDSGEWLIEQENGGVASECPRDSDALLLPSRESSRPATLKSIEMNQSQQRTGSLDPFLRRSMREGRPDVIERRHVREQGVTLENEPDRPTIRRHGKVRAGIEPDIAIALDLAGRRTVEAGDRAQDRGFAAAGWADERQKLAWSTSECGR
jgi:hypothetical protein